VAHQFRGIQHLEGAQTSTEHGVRARDRTQDCRPGVQYADGELRVGSIARDATHQSALVGCICIVIEVWESHTWISSDLGGSSYADIGQLRERMITQHIEACGDGFGSITDSILHPIKIGSAVEHTWV
jgi:hypothetical protein